MNYEFHYGRDLCAISRREGIPVSEIMLRNEMEKSDRSREQILKEMNSNLKVMRESVRKGLDAGESHRGLFSGGDAAKMMSFAGASNMGKDMASVIAAAWLL